MAHQTTQHSCAPMLRTLQGNSPVMLDRLSLEDFLPLVGAEVEVRAFGQTARMTLREAAAIRSPSPRATTPFHLVLGGPPALRMPQGMFRFTHPKLGDIEMFAVPIGPSGSSFDYEIVFN
ncbi:MAG TPA: hypothetical protein VLK26_10985 [Rudaea sp.]|nr:hypothetical protein [Rudaea sp.]